MSTSKEFTVDLLPHLHQSTFQQQLHSFDSHQLIRIFQIKQQKLYKNNIEDYNTTPTNNNNNFYTITNFKIIPQNQPI